MRVGRRAAVFGGALAATTTASRGHAETSAFDPDEDLRNLRVDDLTEAGRRFVIVSPAYMQPGQRLPLVVLLHGLGETGDARLGAHAWLEKYGLGRAWQRLVRPPITRTSTRGEWTDARLAEVSSALAEQPFRGFVMVCPHMPNPRGAAEVQAYTTWLTTSLLARVRREVPQASTDPATTYLAGVSLGGWVSLEVLVRAPGVFGAWAGVQTAIGTWAAEGFVARIADGPAPPRALYVLTSTQDHWRASSEALAVAAKARGLAAEARVVPGPHDQLWLREAGTLETLLWLDRLERRPTGREGGDWRASSMPSRDVEIPLRARD